MSDTVRMRVITVSYYDASLKDLEAHYGTDDPVEAAQIDQEQFRNDGAFLTDHLMAEGNDSEVYVQVFDPGGQMFTDEFMREVIQIVRVEDLEIHVNHDAEASGRVHAKLVGLDGNTLERISLDGYGRSFGFALRSIREQLRVITGK